MVKLWRRKSLVGESVVNRSCEGGTGGGLKIHEQEIQSNLASGSSDTVFSTSDKYLGHSESGQVSGSSIKQLLSYEMSTESEQKRRSPSIIARLMGFEGLSLPEPAQKQFPNNQSKSQNTSSENCSRLRTSKKQQQQFKDVYEVSESVKDENQRYQSRRIATSDISETEMAFLRQRFVAVKRLVTDETCQGSKEFNDALEDLQSNRHLFLRLLREPEPISAKEQYGSRRSNPSPGSHTSFDKSAGNQNHGNKDMPIKLQRDSLRNVNSGNGITHSQKHSNSLRNSKKWLDVSDDTSAFPTKIVVLKPNIRRMQLSEPESDDLSCVSEFESSKRVRNIRVLNADQRAKKHLSDGIQIPKQNTGESRELAKRITEKVRCSLHSRSRDFSHLKVDGSSSDESENDSSYGSDYVSFRRYNTDRNKVAGLSDNTRSYANKEGKKRLSERWKMTHRFQEVGLSKRSTLGEMLSVSESRKESTIVVLAGKGSTKDSRMHNPEEQAWPLGISSRDGWKYGQVTRLSSSTSVPASCNSRGVIVSPMSRKLSNDEVYLPQGIPLKDSSKYMNEIPRHSRGLNDRSQRFRSNMHHSNIVQETVHGEHHVSHISDNPVHDEIPYEKEINAPEKLPLDAGLMNDKIQDAQLETLVMSSTPNEEYEHSRFLCQAEFQFQQHDVRICSTQNSSDKNRDDYATPLNLLSVSPESHSRLKDAEQPSPMSVLSVPFLDDLSSGTECFGSLTADLQGLRMQLQLLKQESEGYAESPMAISSSDDDDSAVSPKISLVGGDSLDSSYIIDALTNIGFYDTDPHTFMTKCHSLDCPIGPAVFEKLEEKYSKQTTWSRSERLLLFDLINNGLVDIFKPFHEAHPWLKQSFRQSIFNEIREVDIQNLEEKLLNWLQVQIVQETDQTPVENTGGKELEWYEYDSAQYIDQVGNEVEDLITKELISEILDM